MSTTNATDPLTGAVYEKWGEAARAGFQALSEFVQSSRQGKRPVDGYYVTMWRLMLRHPELLSWEMLWTDSLRDTYSAMNQRRNRCHLAS